jgi:hypothetical protein
MAKGPWSTWKTMEPNTEPSSKKPMPFNPPSRLQVLVTAMALGTAGAMAPTAQAQSFRDNVINQRCTKAATDDFAKLAKTPPAGFIPFTCNCVVQEINAQVPVDQARATCKAQAIAKFGKP